MNYLSNNSKKLLKELNNLKIDLDKTEIKKNKFFNNLNNKIISIYSNIIINENNLNIITKKSEIIEDSYFISDSLKNKMLNLKIEYVITYENNLIIFKTNKKFNNIKKKIIHSLKIIISLKSLFNRLKASQKITISIFKSGSVIITGGYLKEQIDDAYRFINNLFKEHYHKIIKLSILDFIDEDEEENIKDIV